MNRTAAADEGEEGTGTGAAQRPTRAESSAAQPVAMPGIHALRLQCNWLSSSRAGADNPEQPERQKCRRERRAQYSVHMEGLEAKHLMDALPEDHLRLDHDDAEYQPHERVGHESAKGRC